MTTYRGLAQRLNQLATTKRRDKTGAMFADAQNLKKVKCSYLYPLGSDVKLRMGLDTPHQIFEIFTQLVDIKAGDVFVFAGVDYPVRAAEQWPNPNGRFLRLIVEGLKN